MPDPRPWRPWEHSTGPRSVEGKSVVSQNAYKHGLRSKEMEAMRRYLKSTVEMLDKIVHA